MSQITASATSKTVKRYQVASLFAYVLILATASGLLLIEPNGLDVRTMIMPILVLLLASSVGIGYAIAGKSESKLVAYLGTGALAILFSFIGFFILAAVAWFIGLSYSL